MKLLKLAFLCIALLLSISVGYSKLNQNLSIISTATIEPAQTDYLFSFQLNKWQEGGLWNYQFHPITLTYTGTDPAVTSWDITIAVPPGSQIVSSHFNNCKYSYTSGNLKIYNVITNGSISPNGSVTFGIGFKTSVSNYQLNITNANFYSRTNPNPNLTSVSGQAALTRGSGWVLRETTLINMRLT